MALINSSSKKKSGVSSLLPDLSNLNNPTTVTKPSTLTTVNVVNTPKTGGAANLAASTVKAPVGAAAMRPNGTTPGKTATSSVSEVSSSKAPVGAADVLTQLFSTSKYKNPETAKQQSSATNGAVTGALEGLAEKSTSTTKAPIGAAAMRPIGTTPGKTTDSPVGTSDETPEVSDNNVSNTSAYESLMAAYQQQQEQQSAIVQQLQNQRGWYEEQKNLLAQQLKEQQVQYEAQLKAQQEAQAAAAQNAYNNNIAALQEAYNSRVSGIGSNYESVKAQLADLYNSQMKGLAADYDVSTGELNANAERSLREAYINRMMQEKNLQQQLRFYGLTGGASESAIASLINNYGNSRNNIELERSDNLASLLRDYNTDKSDAVNNYNQSLANALSAYNDALASANESNMAYRMQLENELANNIVSSYGNLYNGLANSAGDYNSLMTNLIANQNDAYSSLLNNYYKRILE